MQPGFNDEPLTPSAFLRRAAHVFPDRVGVVQGELRFTYGAFLERALKFAGALKALGVAPGDRVAVLAGNTHVMLAAHYAVPFAGAVLVALNTRITPADIAYIVGHAGATVLVYDHEYASAAAQVGADRRRAAAARSLRRRFRRARADDRGSRTASPSGRRRALAPRAQLYERNDGAAERRHVSPSRRLSAGAGDGDAHGTHERLGVSVDAADVPLQWVVLPVGGHRNGRRPSVPAEGRARRDLATPARVRRQPFLRGADGADDDDLARGCRRMLPRRVRIATGGAPPTPALLERLAELDMDITHLYGLTETFGPVALCEWRSEWNALPIAGQAKLKARQGVGNAISERIRVVDASGADVPADGETMGEIAIRGNNVMLGYYKDDDATRNAAPDGWFRTGDLGVMCPDGYVALRDRAKDIIISGGENVSSIEVEEALTSHAAVLEVAVVAAPDDKWGEVPVAFVTLKEGAAASDAELIEHARRRLARFKAPKRVIFGPLPKTATGKVQKKALRDQLRGA